MTERNGAGLSIWNNSVPHVCGCGKPFTGPRNAKYCGEKCRSEAFDRQRKAWELRKKAKKAKAQS